MRDRTKRDVPQPPPATSAVPALRQQHPALRIPPAELFQQELMAPFDLVPVLQADDEQIREALDLSRTIATFPRDGRARTGRHGCIVAFTTTP
jgi:hypothetical protein